MAALAGVSDGIICRTEAMFMEGDGHGGGSSAGRLAYEGGAGAINGNVPGGKAEPARSARPEPPRRKGATAR